jgi:hypothetical protein
MLLHHFLNPKRHVRANSEPSSVLGKKSGGESGGGDLTRWRRKRQEKRARPLAIDRTSEACAKNTKLAVE